MNNDLIKESLQEMLNRIRKEIPSRNRNAIKLVERALLNGQSATVYIEGGFVRRTDWKFKKELTLEIIVED